METRDEKLYDRQNLLRLTLGNEEAAEWIQLGRAYIHLFDDIIDENLAEGGDRKQGVQRLLKMAAMALELYSHSWYRKNCFHLAPVMLLANVNFADSIDWEKSQVDWQRQVSDWFRHGWLDAVMMTAYLCGGYDHLASISKLFKQIAWEQHHDAEGNPI